MTVFSYRAINDDGKEVRGSIESADLDAAKSALADLHLDVIEVTEATRIKPVAAPQAARAPSQMTTFAFEGQDSAGTVRRGTVQAATKFDAFNKLKNEQALALNMLAPMGTLPKYNDPDLQQWQKSAASAAPKPQAPAEKAKPKIGFTQTPAPAPVTGKPKAAPAPVKSSGYHPLVSTLALYAGWLLAWYGLFVATGHYATVRSLPWDIPFVQAFYVSPLIFSFTVGIWLFLLLFTLNRAIHGRLAGGIVMTLLGAGIFVAIRSFL